MHGRNHSRLIARTLGTRFPSSGSPAYKLQTERRTTFPVGVAIQARCRMTALAWDQVIIPVTSARRATYSRVRLTAPASVSPRIERDRC
jgi:hypothetical protein